MDDKTYSDYEEDVLGLSNQIRKELHSVMGGVESKYQMTRNEIEVLLFLTNSNCDTAKDIAKGRGYSRSLVSKSVDVLVKRGYIRQKQDQDDRRMVHLILESKAQEVVEEIRKTRKEAITYLVQGITKEEKEVVKAVLKKAIKNLKHIKGLQTELTEDLSSGFACAQMTTDKSTRGRKRNMKIDQIMGDEEL